MTLTSRDRPRRLNTPLFASLPQWHCRRKDPAFFPGTPIPRRAMGRVNFGFRPRTAAVGPGRAAAEGHSKATYRLSLANAVMLPQPWPGRRRPNSSRRPGIQGNGERSGCVAEVAPAFDREGPLGGGKGRLDLGGHPRGQAAVAQLWSRFLPRCGVHRPATLRSGSTDRRTVGGAWRALAS